MNFIFTLDTVSQTKPYEIVVAFLIIIICAIILFFLYRNVMNTIKSNQKEKHAVGFGEINDDKNSKRKKVVLENTILTKIDSDIENSEEGALRVFFYIDLDNFTYIADKYKEKDISKIVKEIEKRLIKYSEGNSLTSHLESDKFVYYYRGEVNNDKIQEVAEDLLSIISKEPLKIDDINMTASIGVCVFPYDAIDADGLLAESKLAVYLAKKQGKNRYHLYSEEQIEKERYNIDYYQDIKNSIGNDEFILYYQPIVDIKTGSIIGMESLLRWNHPEMGVLAPGKFLNVMDLTGDITWFGMWGFEKIVSKYRDWSLDFKIRDLFLSVNLSPKQLYIENLAEQFYEVTQKYDVQADNFAFEILDYYTVIENEIGKKNITDFRKYGFRVSIDESGDNFQLIKEMKDVEANIIKIPRTNLLMIMDDDPAVKQIKLLIKTALENKKIVIIEGVETEEMLKKVAEWDLRFMQGFYFAKPVDEKEARKMAEKSPWGLNSFKKILKK
ncbi:MAG: GGDEF domain-containing phosphodiesterase [Candidatus Izimaplasma sp.]|nr:GGDEF domain-containing phosphodiesterase [Candidatus Izimaplasma bacterium]